MRINGYHHVGLFVTDAQRSLEFYTKLGGRETFSFPMPDNSEKTIYLVDLGNNAVIEIIPRGIESPEENARWAHIALACDDVQAAFDLAVELGATVRSEPREVMLGDRLCANAFIYGPDGEVIEFFRTL